MLQRFGGSVEPLGFIDVTELVAWSKAISFVDWPQQHRLADGRIRPAMVNDFAWHGFGEIAKPIVDQVMLQFPNCEAHQPMLSVVMPGHSIDRHTDAQPPNWICRVHVPLISNSRSKFIVGGVEHLLTPNVAYRVNTEAVHSVENDGDTPRIHFMFDVEKT